MIAIVLDLHSIVDLTDEQFYQLCQANPDIKLERTANGELIVMPPTGWGTGNRNGRLTQRLFNWADADGTHNSRLHLKYSSTFAYGGCIRAHLKTAITVPDWAAQASGDRHDLSRVWTSCEEEPSPPKSS